MATFIVWRNKDDERVSELIDDADTALALIGSIFRQGGTVINVQPING